MRSTLIIQHIPFYILLISKDPDSWGTFAIQNIQHHGEVQFSLPLHPLQFSLHLCLLCVHHEEKEMNRGKRNRMYSGRSHIWLEKIANKQKRSFCHWCFHADKTFSGSQAQLWSQSKQQTRTWITVGQAFQGYQNYLCKRERECRADMPSGS